MLEKLLIKVRTLPTMMSIEEELLIITELMKMEDIVIIQEKKIFFEILEHITTSHYQSVFSINNSNYNYFEKFSERLVNLSNQMNSTIDKQNLNSTSDVMKTIFR